MTLTSKERRILSDIEDHLVRESPRLDAVLTGRGRAERHRVAQAAAVLARHCGALLLTALLAAVAGIGVGTLGVDLHRGAMALAGVALLGVAAATAVVAVLAGALGAGEDRTGR
ncbi:hypothetical protein [Peterkaempfera griseoplana]|uniref:hypothetical protein n=1 Tax=Peterkaempfera griseoplana TaxID=66896 RepID=UPI000B03703A|nr:hypothetical protein [Peterkaempfera griseoplana]